MRGRRLSVVQEFGLALLVRQDNILRGEEALDDIRIAVVASGKKPVDEVFPELFSKTIEIDEDAPDDVLDNPDVDYDYSGVAWESPEGLQEDEMALLEQFLDDSRVEVSQSDLTGPTTPGEWV